MRQRPCLVISLCILLLFSACSSGSAPANSVAPTYSTSPHSPSYDPPVDYSGNFTYDKGQADGVVGGGERYLVIGENHAVAAEEDSTLTFSLKADTASYTNVARYLKNGSLPPHDAVRIEEFINYFSYDTEMSFEYDAPFALYTEVGISPFSADRQMVFVRMKTRKIEKEDLPASNLTFLINTSGSMNSHDKLPLLKEAFGLLVNTLGEDDIVSVVTYADNTTIVLDSVSGTDKPAIQNAIDNLSGGGSTSGADGIMTAYALAEKNLLKGGNNRVVLATDGDFNAGVSDTDALADLVAKKRGNGVYLSVLGFGAGNIRDDAMETLSNYGNGDYHYLSSLDAAKKVLVNELGTNLFTVATDVKAQIEFNPELVKSYRLIGYESSRLIAGDFEDDSKGDGEVGADTDLVMMFELELSDSVFEERLFDVRIRYKEPGEEVSKLITRPVFADPEHNESDDFLFACSVAAFGHLLRNSDYLGNASLESTIFLAQKSLGTDHSGRRLEYLTLLKQYESLVK